MADSPFGISAVDAPDKLTDPRRKRLTPFLRGGLGDLFRSTQAPDDGLSKPPLNEGSIETPISTPGIGGAAAGEPSLLATERVPRSPSSLTASPLLGGEERLGAAVGETIRGEESAPAVGGFQGLTNAQRNQALLGFFRPEKAAATDTAANATSAASSEPSDNSDLGAQIGQKIGTKLGGAAAKQGLQSFMEAMRGGQVSPFSTDTVNQILDITPEPTSSLTGPGTDPSLAGFNLPALSTAGLGLANPTLQGLFSGGPNAQSFINKTFGFTPEPQFNLAGDVVNQAALDTATTGFDSGLNAAGNAGSNLAGTVGSAASLALPFILQALGVDPKVISALSGVAGGLTSMASLASAASAAGAGASAGTIAAAAPLAAAGVFAAPVAVGLPLDAVFEHGNYAHDQAQAADVAQTGLPQLFQALQIAQTPEEYQNAIDTFNDVGRGLIGFNGEGGNAGRFWEWGPLDPQMDAITKQVKPWMDARLSLLQLAQSGDPTAQAAINEATRQSFEGLGPLIPQATPGHEAEFQDPSASKAYNILSWLRPKGHTELDGILARRGLDPRMLTPEHQGFGRLPSGSEGGERFVRTNTPGLQDAFVQALQSGQASQGGDFAAPSLAAFAEQFNNQLRNRALGITGD